MEIQQLAVVTSSSTNIGSFNAFNSPMLAKLVNAGYCRVSLILLHKWQPQRSHDVRPDNRISYACQVACEHYTLIKPVLNHCTLLYAYISIKIFIVYRKDVRGEGQRLMCLSHRWLVGHSTEHHGKDLQPRPQASVCQIIPWETLCVRERAWRERKRNWRQTGLGAKKAW